MKLIFILILSILFSSCTGKKLLVRNADSIIEYQITRRVPLSTEQKKNLEKDVDNFLNQERETAKKLIPLIDEVNLNNKASITPQYDQFVSYYKDLSRNFSILIAKYIADLNDSQRKAFFENLAEENAQFEKRTQDDRREATIERLEKFFGDLTKEQIQIIKSYDSYYSSLNRDKLERRKVLHKEFKVILESNESELKKRRLLVEAYLNHQDKNFIESKFLEATNKLIPTLSDGQREHFRKQASEVQEILRYFIQTNY